MEDQMKFSKRLERLEAEQAPVAADLRRKVEVLSCLTDSEIKELDVLRTSALVPDTGQIHWETLPIEQRKRAEELVAEAQKRWRSIEMGE
jgi:hypothetical protein